jgi:hypothetical protein
VNGRIERIMNALACLCGLRDGRFNGYWYDEGGWMDHNKRRDRTNDKRVDVFMWVV